MESPLRFFIIYSILSHFTACGRYRSPEFQAPIANVSAISGEDVSFQCHVHKLQRNYKIAWLKVDSSGGKLLAWDYKVFRNSQKYRVEEKHQRKLWILHIRNVQPTDAGGYMCQINTNPMISQIGYLNLQVSPQINRDKTSDDKEVREGQNVSFNCAADGSPKPTVKWMRKDGKLIEPEGPDGFGISIFNGPVLNMFKVSRKQMTEFVCVASNGIPPDESWTVKLHVQFPPTIIPVGDTVSAASGTGVQLGCRAEAWPRPEFYWRFGDAVLVPNPSKYVFDVQVGESDEQSFETLSFLTVLDLSASDFGKYSCVAYNELGSGEAAVELQREASGASPWLQSNVVSEQSVEEDTLTSPPEVRKSMQSNPVPAKDQDVNSSSSSDLIFRSPLWLFSSLLLPFFVRL